MRACHVRNRVDMKVADIRVHYPKGISAAYNEIARAIAPFGFEWVQGSVYVCKNNDMGPLMEAVDALKTKAWFRACVRDIRAFRVENWSNLTAQVRRGG